MPCKYDNLKGVLRQIFILTSFHEKGNHSSFERGQFIQY